jgi:hypothetical protein
VPVSVMWDSVLIGAVVGLGTLAVAGLVVWWVERR